MCMKSLQISDRSTRVRQLWKVSWHERDSKAHFSPRSVTIQSNRFTLNITSLSLNFLICKIVRLGQKFLKSILFDLSSEWVCVPGTPCLKEQGLSMQPREQNQTMVFGLCSKYTESNWLELWLPEGSQVFSLNSSIIIGCLVNWR